MITPRVVLTVAVRGALTVAIAGWCTAPSHAQLRIVSYNTATAQNPGTQTARTSVATVLQAIGAQSVGGVAKPIDVLLLQEQFSMELTTQSFVDVLNGLYGAGVYARSALNGLTSDSLSRAGRPGLVYNTQTVQLVGETFFGDVGTDQNEQPRSTLRYQLRPAGYDAAADFYAYNSHWVSDTGTVQNNRRLIQAQSTRANADALGPGAHVIYAGDFNIQTSSSTAYQHLLSAGDGQAFDPINAPGTWNNSPTFTAIHTQSPAIDSQFSGQTLGGLDDRFDFQLVSGELLDGEGMSYLGGSYRAFGNNGTHGCCNSPITAGNGAAPAVLTALMQASDHLPVMADYQLPAKLGVGWAAIPTTLPLGGSFSLDVTVANIAPVVAAVGADELDYTLTVSGDLTGGAAGFDFALASGNLHQVGFNTATPGPKSGLITIASSSPQAANPVVTIPVSYQVVAPYLEADFNQNGSVDGADLAAWQANFGAAAATRAQGDADGDGLVDGADFLTWQRQFGQAPPPMGRASSPVSEPGALALGAFAAAPLALRGGLRRRAPRSFKHLARRRTCRL